MATLILGAVGKTIGASIGGSLFGVSASVLGGFIGTTIGSIIDNRLFAPNQTSVGPRLENLNVTSATEGVAIPRVYGRTRIGGNIIWATDFKETTSVTTQGGKGGGVGGGVKTVEYLYSASFAVALCEGPIEGIGRIWADGKLLDMDGVTWRLYTGNETQTADSLIVSHMGANRAPAYRGVAYVVFEDLPLKDFGNRIPQINFEVFRPLVESDTVEGVLPAVVLMPGSGEFVLATSEVRGGLLSSIVSATTPIANMISDSTRTNLEYSLDQLEMTAPNVSGVSLVVSWFGDDLRCNECTIRPKTEHNDTHAGWSVAGLDRAFAQQVSVDSNGRPYFGGTPSDFSVVEAIKEIKNRGLRAMYYPFILMDIPSGNTLPDPYSDNASTTGQPVFPWRGRITASVAPGYDGSPDKTSAMDSEINTFFGTASASDFSLTPTPDPGDETYATGGEDVAYGGLEYTATHIQEPVTYTGPNEWGYRRFMLHQAMLCKAAGGVDMFCIGSEMRGLTTLRGASNSFPAVSSLVSLAAEVRTILGAGTKITYAADWSEYFGYQPSDGTGDVFFHLDDLWANTNIDVVGIDNYMPLSDWRDGFDHLDAQAGWTRIYDIDYLQSNIEGGEGYDWYYASTTDRHSQTRSTISDSAYGKPWVFRYKDIRNWWLNEHYNRPGGVQDSTSTAWVPQSKPIVFTELGCPALDRGTNQPNVFYDPKSSESAVPYFSRGWRDDAIQRAYLEAIYGYWGNTSNNPTSSVYGGSMVDVSNCYAWAWDARPYPWFPSLTDKWSDGDNWHLGHWLTGRIGSASLPALVRKICTDAGVASADIDVSGLHGAVEGYALAALTSARDAIAPLAQHFGFDAIENGDGFRFVSRDRGSVASLTDGDLVTLHEGDVVEMTRAQETEIPQALKWQVAHSGSDYEFAQVEAQRVTVGSTRVAAESFPFSVPPEEAERRCRRALMEIWTGQERAQFALPPSRLALEPSDIVTLNHSGKDVLLRIVSSTDADVRRMETVVHDREDYDQPPGRPARARPRTAAIPGTAFPIFLDVPWLTNEHVPHQPLIAVVANPWPGDMAVYRAPASTLIGYVPVGTARSSAGVGILNADLPAGPVSIFDRASTLDITVEDTTLTSATDLDLFAGANSFAVESASGQWEILQGADVTLVSNGHYRITRLLRGQRGTEWAMGDPAPSGSRVVVLDSRLIAADLETIHLGAEWSWRIGPADKPFSDTTYVETTFTPQGVGLECFAPGNLQAAIVTSSDDILLTWIRRDRDPAADAWETSVPLSDMPEKYELDILSLDGSSVLRTVADLSTPRYTYSAADQTTDYGSLVSILRVAIYQTGSRGRGYPLEATVSVDRTA